MAEKIVIIKWSSDGRWLLVRSWLSLVLVHAHVLLPVVGENFDLHPLLLLDRQGLPLLLFEPLGVLFFEADSHVVLRGLRVLLRISQAVHGHWLWNERCLDFGQFFWRWGAACSEQALLDCLVEQGASCLSIELAYVFVVFEFVLFDYFVDYTFE